jgi:hypothetical protein
MDQLSHVSTFCLDALSPQNARTATLRFVNVRQVFITSVAWSLRAVEVARSARAPAAPRSLRAGSLAAQLAQDDTNHRCRRDCHRPRPPKPHRLRQNSPEVDFSHVTKRRESVPVSMSTSAESSLESRTASHFLQPRVRCEATDTTLPANAGASNAILIGSVCRTACVIHQTDD